MFWKEWIADIKEATCNMSKKQTCSYIATYYWPHILGTVLSIALIFFIGRYYLFGNQKPVFTCVMVNQQIDLERDQKMEEMFSKESGLDKKRVVIDSDYNFSYKDFQLEGVNESSYEKFFFQWRNGELDAVIMSESFYRYCQELGGDFCSIEKSKIGSFEPYMDNGICTAIVLGNDRFTEKVFGKKDEKLLLSFPKTGKHEAESKQFLKFCCSLQEEKSDLLGL